MSDAFWTIVLGILANVSCAILGCFLVLRRMSLLGDAISHAMLPGIAVAFIFTGKVTGLPILFGAMLFGLLTAWLTEVLASSKQVNEDASLGIVFTSLFAVGILLLQKYARGTDLDPACVLYGNIETAILDLFPLGSTWLPRVLPTMLVALGLILLFVLLCWKELKISTFDTPLAFALGKKPGMIRYILLALVAGVSVSSFEAVGAMLVVSMLIVPAATARLLTDSLRGMLGWSSLIAAISAIVAYPLAVRWNSSFAGVSSLVVGGIFALAFLFAPKYGLVFTLLRRFKLTMRIIEEDLLGLLYRRELEAREHDQTVHDDWQRASEGWKGRIALWRLFRKQLVRDEVGVIHLTESGRERAVQMVRAHRLWESYLEQNMALPMDHLHVAAHQVEHYVGPELREEIEAQLDHPTTDPQGRMIPKK